MRLDDTTTIKITRVARANGRFSVQMQLTDSVTGTNKGIVEQSWDEATELPAFLAQQQTLDNFAREVIKPTLNAGTGKYLVETLTGKAFDATGKAIIEKAIA